MSSRKKALVLEGGGYRGVFTAGVLDVFMEKGIYAFDDVWGTSAGGLNAANYKAQQIGRQIRVTLAFRDDRRMMSFYSLATTGSIVDNDFMYERVQNEIDPFDWQTFNANPLRMWTVSTNVVFGTAEYALIEMLPRDIEFVKSSASLPLFSENIAIDHQLFLDGGTADSVAVEAALGLEGFAHPKHKEYRPASRAVVVLTQPRSYHKSEMTDLKLAPYKRKYSDYPYFIEAVKNRPSRYNEQRQRIWELERAGKVLVIAPDEPLGLQVTEQNGQKLLEAYLKGRKAASGQLQQIKDFLAE